MPTRKMKCYCKNKFQDKRYGKQVRVFNFAGKGSDRRFYRCTVCGKVNK